MARMKNTKLKLTRRVRIGVVAFESYGIQRGDIATVAMTGDVRMGELGLFRTGSYRGGAPGVPRTLYTTRWLALLSEQDENCNHWAARDGGICLRGRYGCNSEHGGGEFGKGDEHDEHHKQRGGVLVQTYGRVVAIERNGEPVKTTLPIRELDEREQATTAFCDGSYPTKRDKTKPAPKAEPRLAFVDKRAVPLTSEQHEEIARLIKSSMDSTAKNPKPELTYEGLIVVRREVTTLARVADVRRLQSHNVTFRRALAAFERKLEAGKLTVGEQRRGRLAIEHLWRWLHGYVKPIEPRYFHGTKTRNPAARQGGTYAEASSGLMLFTVPYDVDQYHEGDTVYVERGAEIPNGALGVVTVHGEMMIGPIFQTDPYHIRVGFDYEDIYKTSQVKIIGPVVSGDCKPTSVDEWPDVIGGTD